MLPGGRPLGRDSPGRYADVEGMMVVLVVVLGTNALVVGGATVLGAAIDFGTAEIAVSPADTKELIGELNITELNPGNEILCSLDDGPAVPHSSNDNRFAAGFFLAFNS